MQELNESKKREKKYQAEIQILKAQIKSKPATPAPTPEVNNAQKKKEYANKDLGILYFNEILSC